MAEFFNASEQQSYSFVLYLLDQPPRLVGTGDYLLDLHRDSPLFWQRRKGNTNCQKLRLFQALTVCNPFTRRPAGILE